VTAPGCVEVGRGERGTGWLRNRRFGDAADARQGIAAG
jgi:hypothetical protein